MKILIMTSGTGKGHDMQALAIKEWSSKNPYLGYQVDICKPLEDSHWLYAFGVGLYNWIQKKYPLLHHIYYNFLEYIPIVRYSRPLGSSRFRVVLENVRPDIIISVHDSLNHGFMEFAREVLGKENVMCVTYCSELSGGYGFSRHWVNASLDLFIGSVEETCEEAIKIGIDRSKTYVGGFLARPDFYYTEIDAASRGSFLLEHLDMNPKVFTLLLLASGNGAQNHVKILTALKNIITSIQIIVLCGESSKSWLEVRDWLQNNQNSNIKILSHNSNIPRLMHTVSAVMARPGGGVISEAIVSQCPLILNCIGGLMPQEIINVVYCRQKGIGVAVNLSDDLVELLSIWSTDNKSIVEIKERMKELRKINNPAEMLKRLKAL